MTAEGFFQRKAVRSNRGKSTSRLFHNVFGLKPVTLNRGRVLEPGKVEYAAFHNDFGLKPATLNRGRVLEPGKVDHRAPKKKPRQTPGFV
jgi:hypothetical protein